MRLLVLTHTFPPSRHANAKRPGYVVKGFLDAGWTVDVLTTSMGMAEGAPAVLKHSNLRVFRREILADRVLTRCSNSPKLYRIAGLAIAGSSWPDIFSSWVLRAMGERRRLGTYDKVLAFVMPASMLLSGIFRDGVNRDWTFDYQESLTPHLRRHGRRSPLQRCLRPALEKLERHTLHKAGRVIFTAETNRLAYIREGLVGAEATAHIPYFFEDDLFSTPPPPLEKNFEIVYFGTFDWTGSRSPETFLRSLQLFLNAHPEARELTKFVFYGAWLSEHDKLVSELGLTDVVSIRKAVSYKDYIGCVRSSPVLLLVVAAAHNLFMPSKIVDYFGAGRPILAYVPRDSEMFKVLQNAGMGQFACEELDAEAGSRALERLWELFRNNRLQVETGKTKYWSSETQLPRYIQAVSSGSGV